MPPIAYYDRNGERISQERWTELAADPDYVHVACTILRDGRKQRIAKTVWVGFNPMHNLDHYPVEKIYATSMRRGRSESFTDHFTITAQHAQGRHDEAVAELAAELANPTIRHLDAADAFTV